MESKYWDIKEPMSYNCLMNFIIGNRGAGKSFGAKDYAIEQYLKAKKDGRKWEWVYVRRREEELKKLTKQKNGRLFKDIAFKYPDHEFRAESNYLYCDDEVFGYAIQLSTAQIQKSDAFPDVQLIVFDEFITASKGNSGYLPNEVSTFLDLYETIARPGTDHPRVPVLFLSNAVSISNPYFDYYHLDKPRNGNIQRFGPNKGILVQNVVSQAMVDAKNQTEFYKINAGTEYYDYAVNNDWLLDNEDFIEKKTGRSQYYITLRYKDTYLGIWRDRLQGLFYVSLDVDKQCPHVYSATTDDHMPNTLLFKSARKIPWMKSLIDAYEYGCMRYESIKLKNWFRDIMRMRSV